MVIIDTSVAYKWFIDEEPKEITIAARALLKRFLKRKEKILCPDLILYELANTLAYKPKLRDVEINSIWSKLSDINLPIANPTQHFMKKCIDFSVQYRVSVYDASYAILALEKNCILLTADSKFAKKINLPFVKLLTRYPLSNKNLYKRVGKDWNN